MLENIGGTEILVIMVVIFIFFGPKKMPEIGKSLGKAVREFKNALRGIQDDIEKSTKL
jgi:sec-independent protein translocase protein TatA